MSKMSEKAIKTKSRLKKISKASSKKKETVIRSSQLIRNRNINKIRQEMEAKTKAKKGNRAKVLRSKNRRSQSQEKRR